MLALIESQVILKTLSLSPSDELYLLDAQTLTIIDANEEAKAAVDQEITQMDLPAIERFFGINRHVITSQVSAQKKQQPLFNIQSNQPLLQHPANGRQLRVMLVQSGLKDYILVTRSEISPSEKIVMALTESEERYEAIVSNMPGLVFQMGMDEEGEIYFSYVKEEGSHDLLGISAEELLSDSNAFLTIMNARDRSELRSKLRQSSETQERLDWEGRVWIDGWQDTKWVNIRASTRQLSNGHAMWDGFMVNITQSKLEKQAMEQSRLDLEKLNARMSHIKEQERISIAREIHDDLGGNLTAIKMSLVALNQQAEQGKTVTPEQLHDMENIVNSTFEAVHKISGNLRPSVLDLGIVDALEWQVNQFKKQVEIDANFITSHAEISLSTDQTMALYRICQESLSNIAKYAKATAVTVGLKHDAGDVILSIADNGVGINSEDKLKANSFGLRGMHERMSALHGQLTIQSPHLDDSGTEITAKMPI